MAGDTLLSSTVVFRICCVRWGKGLLLFSANELVMGLFPLLLPVQTFELVLRGDKVVNLGHFYAPVECVVSFF